MAAGGWTDRLGAPEGPPPWLTQADLDSSVGEFKRAGFRADGGPARLNVDPP